MAENVTAAHATKLTAAGCPPAFHADISEAVAQGAVQGVDLDDVCQLAKLSPAFNWGALADAAKRYGPSIIAAFIQIFSGRGAGASATATAKAP